MSPNLTDRRVLLAVGSLVVVVCGLVLVNTYVIKLGEVVKVEHVLIAVELVLIGVVALEIHNLRVTRKSVDRAVHSMDQTVKVVEKHVATIASDVDRAVHAMKGTVQDVEKHVATIAMSVRLLERDKIYFYLSETARDAKRSVHHLSLAHASLEIPDEEERKRVNEFLDALRVASGRLGADHVKILGPDLSAKIGGLWERKKAGCQVKVSPAVSNYDIRIQIVDGAKVVIGVGEPAKPSESGFLIESEVLARMLDEDFLALWRKTDTLSLDAHTVNVVTRQVATVPLSLKQLHHIIKDQLHVTHDDVKDIQDLLEREGHLICSGSDVYRETVFDGCLGVTGGTREGVAQYLAGVGFTITDTCLDRLLRFLGVVLKPSDVTPEEVFELAKEGGDTSDAGLERLNRLLARKRNFKPAPRATAANTDEVDDG